MLDLQTWSSLRLHHEGDKDIDIASEHAAGMPLPRYEDTFDESALTEIV